MYFEKWILTKEQYESTVKKPHLFVHFSLISGNP